MGKIMTDSQLDNFVKRNIGVSLQKYGSRKNKNYDRIQFVNKSFESETKSAFIMIGADEKAQKYYQELKQDLKIQNIELLKYNYNVMVDIEELKNLIGFLNNDIDIKNIYIAGNLRKSLEKDIYKVNSEIDVYILRENFEMINAINKLFSLVDKHKLVISNWTIEDGPIQCKQCYYVFPYSNEELADKTDFCPNCGCRMFAEWNPKKMAAFYDELNFVEDFQENYEKDKQDEQSLTGD